MRPVQLKILVREVCLRGHVRAGEKEREGREERGGERVRESASGSERVGGRPRAVAIYVNIFLMVSSETFAMLLGKNMKH